MHVTIRQMLLLVLLVAINSAAVSVSLGHYPHRRLDHGGGGSFGYEGISHLQDGSSIYFRRKPDFTDLKRIWPAYDPRHDKPAAAQPPPNSLTGHSEHIGLALGDRRRNL